MEVGIEFLPCPLCSIPYFKDVHSLRSTLIKVATTQLTCPVCKENVMGLDKLTIHLFIHMNDNFHHAKKLVENMQDKYADKASSCPNSVEDNMCDNLVRKLDSCPIASKEDPIVCDICNFSFTDRTILELHQKLLHQTNPDKQTGAYSFHCHLCSKTFKMRGSLIVHLRVAHYGFLNDNIKSKKPLQFSSHSEEESWGIENFSLPKIVDNKQWECDICSKMFTTKYFLKKHKRLHTGEMPYSCSLCNKSFTFQQSYHKHMNYHSSEKPHICNECGRSFKELSTLQNHARIHSGERPFGCETCARRLDAETSGKNNSAVQRNVEENTNFFPVCHGQQGNEMEPTEGKRFRQRVSYLVHRRIHTGVMPYDCKICGKKFRYKVSQRSHKCEVQSENHNKDSENIDVLSNRSIEENDVRCILSVDHDGTISFITKNDNLTTKTDVNRKYEGIEQSLPAVSNGEASNNNEDINNHIFGVSTSVPDLYSMILSPLLPEVESLCLSNSPTTRNVEGDKDNHCQIRNNKSEQYLSENLFNDTSFLQRN